MGRQFQALFFIPAPAVTGEQFILEIDGHQPIVGLHSGLLADSPRRDGINIGIETDREVFVNQQRAGLSAIRQRIGQRPQSLQPVDGPVTGRVVFPDIGLTIQPLPHLGLHIGKSGESPQGPEVLAKIFDGTFHLAFLVRRPNRAGVRTDAELAEKFQEGIVETNHRADPFGHCGEHIVDHDFFWNAAKIGECLQQALVEIFLALTMGERDIQHPTVPFDYRESVKFSAIRAVGETGEVAPVDLDLLSRFGLETDKRLTIPLSAPELSQHVSDNGDFSGKTLVS